VKRFNLADLFEIAADGVPDRSAIVGGDVRRTYRQLEERSTRFGQFLLASGCRAGEHIAILGWNSVAWVEAMLGAYKARLAVVNVNYRYTRGEVVHILNDSESVVLVGDADVLDDLPEVIAEVPSLRQIVTLGGDTSAVEAVEFEAALASASPERGFGDRSPDDKYILYTGGTTGRPKGVVWRAEDLFFAALGGGNVGGPPIERPEQLVDYFADGWSPWVVTSPLMHGNGQWNTFVPLLAGRGVALWTARRFDGAAIARLAARERAQLVVLVGDGMAIPFLDAIEDDESVDLSSVAVIGSGGAMLSSASKERLAERLPGCLIVDGFGASETGGGGAMIGTGGGGLPRFSMADFIKVLDDDLRPVRPGEVGRLARRGHIPLGYWNDPEKTAAAFQTDAEGVRWSVPGDMACLEDDGTVTLLGRGSTCINTGGEKVYPEEVADAIKTHPNVADAIVVGVPDERWGQAVVAVVASTHEPAPDLEDLKQHLQPLLAGYKAPRRVVQVHVIHYTPQGKPDIKWAEAAARSAFGR
jgi:fatty-acyl-CoA synthase